jgi:TonB-linked SusC/RagA family outer membrane protein
MKNKLLTLLFAQGKYVLGGAILQMLLLNALYADNLNAQEIKSVHDVTITVRNQSGSLEEIFRDIERQTNYVFSYLREDIRNATSSRPLQVARRTSVANLLLEISGNYNLKFKQVNNVINVVPRKGQEANENLEVIIQTRRVTGRVTAMDEADGLPGVNVVEKGTLNGTVTDITGRYSLEVSEGATLVFSSVGYTTEEMLIGTRTVIDLVMTLDIRSLEEIVVVGYGIQEKMNVTGSITSINAEELGTISVPTLSQSLMGRSPGLFIKNKKGQPGEDGIDMNIRGYGSPLIIVDGSPVSQAYFQQLEPNDIESINVLKDASAAAAYGARAGNGVIIVTTKRGIESAPKFSYSGSYTFQYFPVVPQWVGSAEYAEMKNLGFLNEGGNPEFSKEAIQKYRDGSDPVNYPNTNWWKETLRDLTPQQQHNLSVRGGTQAVKYFTSLSYFNQKGMHVSNDTDHNRFTLRSNIDVQMTKRLNFGFDISLTNQTYIGPVAKLERTGEFGGIMGRIWRSRPFAPNTPLPDPTKVPAMLSGATINPYYMGFIEHTGFNEWNRVYGFGKLRFEYELPYGFKAQAIVDMNRTYRRERLRPLEMPQYDLENGVYVEKRRYSNFNYLREENAITRNFNQQYILTWNRQFADHQFNALFVRESLSDHYDFLMGYRRDFEFPLDFLFAGPNENMNNDGRQTEGGRIGYVSRINYNFKGKYLFEVSGRYDGSPKFRTERELSSRFMKNLPPLGQDPRWGFFPSASIGWRISDEPFIKDNINMLPNLKLRASHGLLGYDAAGSFQYLRTYSMRRNNNGYIYDTGVQSGIRADAEPNLGITWEKMKTSNVGVDFNLWDGRLLEGSIDYFYRLRADVLGSRLGTVSPVVGATLPRENIEKYDNRGWELVLNHSYRIGELRYSIGGNIATNREKTVWVDQTDPATMEHNRRSNVIGEWTDRFWAYPTAGLFQSQEEIDNWADIDGQGNRTIRPGDIKYIDYNNDGRISAEDMILAGRGTSPRLMYGVNFSLSWRAFDLMTLWQGAGLYNINMRAGGRDFVMPFYAENTPTMYMYRNMYTPENEWIPANTTNAVWPRYFGTDSNNRSHRNYNLNNEFWLADGSYIRLKNVQLAYSVPERMTRNLGMDVKVYGSGYNVLTFFKHKYVMDPEIDTSPAREFGDYHPPLGSFTFGVQLGLK